MKYGFIGCGNMGSALAKAAAQKNGEIYLCDRHPEKLAPLAEATGGSVQNGIWIAGNCDYIFIGVKPQALAELFSEIGETLAGRTDRFVLVSMAAGTSIAAVRALAKGNCPVIRIMPNLPVSAGAGAILYCAEGTEDAELQRFLDVMGGAGMLVEIKEKLIDAGSAVSGCGPAFAFLFIESLADGGVACGLPRDKAQMLAAQTLLGSAKLLLESGKHPGELKDAVCSPGGTTIAGVRALEEGAFRADSANAVIRAYERTLELAKGK